jgi:Bax protein
MMRREILLAALLLLVFAIFLPEMVPGRGAECADEISCSLVEYGSPTTFPEAFSRIQNPRERKQVLIDLLLPLVLKANDDILAQRKELERIRQAPGTMSPKDRQMVEDLARVYHVDRNSPREMLDELLVRVDVLPVSLVLAQAGIESGWGTSRFALQGNNVFGLRGPKGLGMAPGERTRGCDFSLATFGDLQECISYYLWNINTHNEYEQLRKLRTQKHIHYDPLVLAQGLNTYSEMGDAYVEKVVGVIRELQGYDSYRLRPMKEQRTARVIFKSSGRGDIS